MLMFLFGVLVCGSAPKRSSSQCCLGIRVASSHVFANKKGVTKDECLSLLDPKDKLVIIRNNIADLSLPFQMFP